MNKRQRKKYIKNMDIAKNSWWGKKAMKHNPQLVKMNDLRKVLIDLMAVTK